MTVSRTILGALVLAALAVAAHAAPGEPEASGQNAGSAGQDTGSMSIESMAAKLKSDLPDSLTVVGVTLYGTVDVGFVYQTYGAPQNPYLYLGGLDLLAYGVKNFNRSNVTAFSGNGLSQSFVGLKIDEKITDGFNLISRLESGFNPWSGYLADACGSLASNNGKSIFVQSANLDGNRCGQILNGSAFAGIQSDHYGTLTGGRHNSFNNDIVGVYDPFGGSYAFSLIGFSGGSFAGIGDTETARWDNSVKYLYTYGPVHAGAMYAAGAQGSAIHRDAYAANVGGTYGGFSIDFDYTKENSVVGASSLSAANCISAGFSVGCDTAKLLNATITDDQGYAVAAKYTIELGERGLKDGGGGMKDSASPADTLTFYAGYQYAELANPSQPVPAGSTTEGDYMLFSINNQPYFPGAERVLQTAWAGAKYALANGWSFTAAYYHVTQNAYATSASGGPSCADQTAHNVAGRTAGTFFGYTTGSNCEGDYNQGSFAIDYAFNKYFDIYSGVSYSQNSGGLESGALQNNTTTVMTGLRLRF
jgi:predicted porin